MICRPPPKEFQPESTYFLKSLTLNKCLSNRNGFLWLWLRKDTVVTTGRWSDPDNQRNSASDAGYKDNHSEFATTLSRQLLITCVLRLPTHENLSPIERKSRKSHATYRLRKSWKIDSSRTVELLFLTFFCIHAKCNAVTYVLIHCYYMVDSCDLRGKYTSKYTCLPEKTFILSFWKFVIYCIYIYIYIDILISFEVM